MEYTKNYHLPQWKEDDRIMMRDFNDAMAGIEDGLTKTAESAAELPYVAGQYTGNGQTDGVAVNVGFRPSFVIVSGMTMNSGIGAETLVRFGFGGPGSSVSIYLTDTGFLVKQVPGNYPRLNLSGTTYGYIAFR